MVARMASQSRTISENAAPGFLRPKNRIDQIVFRKSCPKKTIMAAWAACHPAVLNTSHAATAIRMYNVVHTGPKIQRGGVHVGFLSVGYQVFTDDAVKIDPMPPDAKQSTTKMMSISRSPFTVPVLR